METIIEERRSETELEFDRAIEKVHRAVREFSKGNPEPMKEVFSHREDATLAGPLGPPGRGWKNIADIMDRNASQIRDGEIPNIEIISKHITPDMAYILEIEWQRAKVGGSQEMADAPLRVTMIFEKENGTWKVVHRHADGIVKQRTAADFLR